MFNPDRKWFVPRWISGVPFRRAALFYRPTRLHAERLEDRMMMSASHPKRATDVLAPVPELRPAQIAVAGENSHPANATVATGTKTRSLAAEALPQRFRSTEEFRAWLVEAATTQWGALFGQSQFQPYLYGKWYLRGAPMLFNNPALDFVTTNSLGSNYSTTNLQVEGVDEADFVETDGDYLYIISGQDLIIVRAGEGEDLKVMSRVHLNDHPVGMYLSGNRLAIVSSDRGTGSFYDSPIPRLIDIPFAIDVVQFGEYGASIPQRPTTTVTVLDVTNRSAPTLVQKTQMDGQLVSSRTVDGELRLVLTNDLLLPMPIAHLVESDPRIEEQPYIDPLIVRSEEVGRISVADMVTDYWSPTVGSNYVYESMDEYVSRIKDEVLESLNAHIRSLAADGTVISDAQLVEPTDIYRPENHSARSLTTIATFDLNSNQSGPTARATVLTGEDTKIYASADSVYVFSSKEPDWNGDQIIAYDGTSQTSVWKFTMGGPQHTIKLAAKGDFTGSLLNQFAADEQNGYLRVVTNSGGWSNGSQSVTVLQQVGKHLNVVGSVSGIAANESLYSVRFMGDRAYFVTYRRIDPLFAVDLNDPTNPKLLGELEVPGYSNYLQPIDGTHLLAIGRDTVTLDGGFEEPDALQISIFDVSDPSHPQLSERYSFGGGFSTVTPATGSNFAHTGGGDHHAVSYFTDQHILALPIQSTGDCSSWLGNGDAPLFEPGEGGLQVFKIDTNAGFIPIGLIQHDTPIERSVQIGDHLFAISQDSLSVHDLMHPDIQLGKIRVGADAGMPLTKLEMYVVVEDKSLESLIESPRGPVGKSAVAESHIQTAMTPELSAGSVLPPQAQSRHTGPAWLTALNAISASHRFDNNLLQTLAADVTRDRSSSDLSTQSNHVDGDDAKESRYVASEKHRRISRPERSSASVLQSLLTDTYSFLP